MDLNTLNTLRREYGQKSLSEQDAHPDPIAQFQSWLTAALATGYPDATAMVLATTDLNEHADTRVLLLKSIDHGFIFYTNYESVKAQQLEHMPFCALNFYWFFMVRQVRIRGSIERLTLTENETYFQSRPRDSQINAIISQQSKTIDSRHALEIKLKNFSEVTTEKLHCPENWGGYRVLPTEFEFFQGRDARCHDRLRYLKVNNAWEITRLAP